MKATKIVKGYWELCEGIYQFFILSDNVEHMHSVHYALELVAIAKRDFPALGNDSFLIQMYKGGYYDRQMVVTFVAYEVPDDYKEADYKDWRVY